MTDPSPTDRARRLLRDAGIVRSRDLERAGVSRSQIRRLREAGHIDRVGRGLYTLPGAVLGERHSLAEVGRRVPRGVVCLLSALRFHGLTTQNPFEVWMAIELKVWRPKSGSPPLRLVHMSEASFRSGVEEHEVGGVPVHVYSAAKTVADCFKFRNKIGLDTAVEAIRFYRERRSVKVDELMTYASICRVKRIIRPYLEAIL